MSLPVSSDTFAIDENIEGDASGLRHNFVITNLSLINPTGWTSLYVGTGADVLDSGAPCIPWQPYIYDQVKMNLSGTTIAQDYKPYLDVYWTDGGGSAPGNGVCGDSNNGKTFGSRVYRFVCKHPDQLELGLRENGTQFSQCTKPVVYACCPDLYGQPPQLRMHTVGAVTIRPVTLPCQPALPHR